MCAACGLTLCSIRLVRHSYDGGHVSRISCKDMVVPCDIRVLVQMMERADKVERLTNEVYRTRIGNRHSWPKATI